MLRDVGTAIRVLVDPTCISTTDWSLFYQETLRVLHGWPHLPLRPRTLAVAGVPVIAFTSDVESPKGWQLCGDATSRLIGDMVELPRSFGVEAPRPPPTEIVLRALDDDAGLDRLLESEATGQPYQALVIAVAMLAEHRFARAAFIGGDLPFAECWTAQERLLAILGQTVPLPIATDPVRLYDRLHPHLAGTELQRAIERAMTRPDPSSPPVTTVDAELDAAVSCTDVQDLSPMAREAIRAFVHATKIQARRAQLPIHLPGIGGRGALETVARATVAYHLALTTMAWDRLERASAPELELLTTVAQLQPSGRLGYPLSRALFESEAIRRFALERWAEPKSGTGSNSTRLPS